MIRASHKCSAYLGFPCLELDMIEELLNIKMTRRGSVSGRKKTKAKSRNAYGVPESDTVGKILRSMDVHGGGSSCRRGNKKPRYKVVALVSFPAVPAAYTLSGV